MHVIDKVVLGTFGPTYIFGKESLFLTARQLNCCFTDTVNFANTNRSILGCPGVIIPHFRMLP